MSDQVLSQAEIDAMIANAPPPAPAPSPPPIIAAAPEPEPPATPLPPRAAADTPPPAADARTPTLARADRPARPLSRIARAPATSPPPAAAAAPPAPDVAGLRDAQARIARLEGDVNALRGTRASLRRLDAELQSLRQRLDDRERNRTDSGTAGARRNCSLWSTEFYVEQVTEAASWATARTVSR